MWHQLSNLNVCVTNHHLVLHLVLYPFHATSDRTNKHSVRNHDDHAVQRCQLQLLSNLQRCPKPCAHCKYSPDLTCRSHLLTFGKGPFTTKITSDYLLITQIACIPNTSGITRRHALPEATPEPTALYIRGAKPQTFTPIVKTKVVALPKLVDHFKRQAPANAAGSPLILTGESFRLVVQLNTVIFAAGVLNSGADLGETCLQLQSANAILDLARVALNATQAAAIVCGASLPDADLASFNQTLVARTAFALLGVEIAANSTGTVETGQICNQLDLSSLSTLGIDVNAVQSFVCSANNASSTTSGANNATTTASVTSSPPTNGPSAGTLTPFPFTNSSGGTYTWVGSITVTGPVGTAVTAPWGTGLPASGTGFYPTGNLTAVAGTAGSGTAIYSTGSIPAATGRLGPSTALNGTGNLPAGTGSVANGTVVDATGKISSATGNAGPGTSVDGTGNLPTGTGVVGTETSVWATGDASAGYAASATDSGSNSGGYGQESSERLPRGPTSTPRYYPRYF